MAPDLAPDSLPNGMPVAGWYPDPTGLAQLRFWDGGTWTGDTAPQAGLPGTPAGGADETPVTGAGTHQQAVSAAAQTFTTTYANRPRPKRNKSVYTGVAATAAAVAAVALVVPIIIAKATPPSSHSAIGDTSTVTAGGPGSIHLPDSFDGYPRLTDPQIRQAEAEVRKSWPFHTAFQFGAYGNSVSQPHAAALAANVPVGSADKAVAAVNQMMASMQRSQPGVAFESQPTGAYGGAMQCVTATANAGEASICVFADKSTVGVTMVWGTEVTTLSEAVALRSQLETPPV